MSVQMSVPCKLEEHETHSSKSAVCPREHCVVHTCIHARTHITVLSTCALRILLNFALSTVCTSDELEWSPFSLSVYSVVCPNAHRISALRVSLSSLSHSLFLCLALSFPLSLSLLFTPPPRVSAEANWQRLWDRFGKTLSTVNVGHSKLFYFLCACAWLPIIWLCS